MSSEWAETTLGQICASQNGAIQTGPFGSQLHTSDYKEVGIPVVMPTNIGDGGIVEDGIARINQSDVDRLSQHKLQIGDIVFSRRGDVTKNALIRPHEVGWFCGTGCLKVRLGNESIANAKFISHCLRLPEIKNWLVRHAVGATMPNLNTGILSAVPINLPPLSTQLEIAATLGALDDRIALLRETNATLEAIAQALFKSWFVDFDPVRAKQEGREPEGMDVDTAALFPDSFEESALGLVPRGWSVGSIVKIAEVIDCLHAKKPELQPTGRPYLQLNSIRDDGLLDTSKLSFISEPDYNKWISRIEVSEGDCVITNVGRVGAVAQIPSAYRAAMGRNMTAIRMRKEWPYPTYLLELLQSPWMEVEIQRRTDIGTILDALNVRNIPLLRCVLAGHDILTAFEDATRPVRAAMEANLERSNTLATLRDTLLPRLISGQLRLPEAEALA